MENGPCNSIYRRLMTIYLLKIDIFHSFLYVYQRVGTFLPRLPGNPTVAAGWCSNPMVAGLPGAWQFEVPSSATELGLGVPDLSPGLGLVVNGGCFFL